MAGKLGFDFSFGGNTSARKVVDKARILILGHFAGDDTASSARDQTIYRVDWDNFDDLLKRFAPSIVLQQPIFHDQPAITITSLDDFHPDALFQHSDLFAALRDLRARLQNSTTFAQAAAEWRALQGDQAPAQADRPDQNTTDASDLDRLLGQDTAPVTHAPAAPKSKLDALLRHVVGSAAINDPDPQQATLLDALDVQIGGLMRQVLHDPTFEQTESLWRSVFDLISNVDHSEELTIHLTQMSKQALANDLRTAGERLDHASLYKRLVMGAAGITGGEPWSIVVADYLFSERESDITILARLGAIAEQAGGVLLTGAEPGLTGAPDRAALSDPTLWLSPDDVSLEHWRALRVAPIARSIGIILPRVLVRYPYGRKAEPITSFSFEEQQSTPDSELFLWGNGAFLCARLLAQSFVLNEGWQFNVNAHLEVDGLPMWTFDDQGQTEIAPVAEVQMAESTAMQITRRGLMALCSVRHRNAARLHQFISAANGERALDGAWNG